MFNNYFILITWFSISRYLKTWQVNNQLQLFGLKINHRNLEVFQHNLHKPMRLITQLNDFDVKYNLWQIIFNTVIRFKNNIIISLFTRSITIDYWLTLNIKLKLKKNREKLRKIHVRQLYFIFKNYMYNISQRLVHVWKWRIFSMSVYMYLIVTRIAFSSADHIWKT